jgi:hypothetical protein
MVPSPNEYRLGNIVAAPPDGVAIINGISGNILEVQSLFEDIELHLIETEKINGYPLIQGYGDSVPEMLIKENCFLKLTDTLIEKKFEDGSELKIQIDYFKNGWNIEYKRVVFYANYVHEFQNVYYTLTKEDLKIKQFKRILS